MGQESKKGTDFYRKQGLRSVTVHVSKEIHAKLKSHAFDQSRSLQKTLQIILRDFVKTIK